MTQARITRVRLENYKSIKFCDVNLEPITVLVGQNGSGKSNFLDAIFFISDALQTSLSDAIKTRRGLSEIINKDFVQSSHLPYFQITLGFTNNRTNAGEYRLKIIWDKSKDSVEKIETFIIDGIDCTNEIKLNTSYSLDDLILNQFYEVPAKFAGFCFGFKESILYNPLPEKMKSSENNQFEEKFESDGSNISSVIYKLQKDTPELINTISKYFTLINPFFVNFYAEKIKDAYLFLNFRSTNSSSKEMTLFNVSSGTARALALLLAIFIPRHGNPNHYEDLNWKPLLGFEEPELGLHPAATRVILAAMRQQTDQAQFVITTHSPDLLQDIQLEVGKETVLVVETFDGETVIDEIDSASRESAIEKLFDLGELLRMGTIQPKSLVGKL